MSELAEVTCRCEQCGTTWDLYDLRGEVKCPICGTPCTLRLELED